MKTTRLAKTSFFRKFENIGYLFNEITRKDLVLDESGAVFLSELGRKAEAISALAQRIAAKFVNAEPATIERDLRELLLQLEADGFVVCGDSAEELDSKEPAFSYAAPATARAFMDSLEQGQLPSAEILRKHFKKYPRLFSMQVEITSYCNLKCMHCYLGDEHAPGGLPKEKLFSLMDQLADMGTLEVTFTGGEAFSRPDLPELLRYARKKDFSISLLTNNILLTDNLLATIKDTGVALVQVSVYSMKPEVHDAITQQSGSWQKTVKNIERLIGTNIPVQVGCPVMKENLESFTSVLEWGRKMRFRVKTDLMLMARTDFSTENLKHRLSEEECETAIRRVMATDIEYQEMLNHKDRTQRAINPEDPVCGVGSYMLCMAANGDFYPCPGFKLTLGNINTNTVAEVWKDSEAIKTLRQAKNASYPKCMACPSLQYCSMCLAKFYNESGGDIYKLSDYFCNTAHANKRLAEDFVATQQNGKAKDMPHPGAITCQKTGQAVSMDKNGRCSLADQCDGDLNQSTSRQTKSVVTGREAHGEIYKGGEDRKCPHKK